MILRCVRWYCRHQLSYRDLEEMMRERGLSIDQVTVFGWVRRYAPEIDKRIRPHLRMSGASYRIDETYVKVAERRPESAASLEAPLADWTCPRHFIAAGRQPAPRAQQAFGQERSGLWGKERSGLWDKSTGLERAVQV